MRQVAVPPGYRCPLCPNHDDDQFFPSPLFEGPICLGCSIELASFAEEAERRDDFLIDMVEQLTGRAWSECRVVILQSELEYRERLQGQALEVWIEHQMRACGCSRQEALESLAGTIYLLRAILEKAARSPGG
jgi:hypothetical protein